MRASGILMHISSLPSAYGIGTFGQAAFDFVDFLAQAGQTYWQVLPLGPTSFGDSPYQSFSTFAGNPYFIDLDLLAKDGLLQQADYQYLDWGGDPARVDYEKIYRNRYPVLRKAFLAGRDRYAKDLEEFRRSHVGWIEDYALFMALKNQFGGCAWLEWEDGIRRRVPEALERYRVLLKEEIDFWVFVQYLFFTQWFTLKKYAHEKKVHIIGDLPIYVAMDSADTWAHPELFQLDEQQNPAYVAGVPPDYFAPQGQLWGNPLYDWDYHDKTGYAWWTERVRMAATVYDMVRIDHFRGFAGYYAVPYGDSTAENGSWREGPGIRVFDAIRAQLGSPAIIAEDLGVLTPDVYDLLEKTGFPGMKVLQFAFDSNWDNAYLPHNHIKNCVVYTGTHDNDTVASWWEAALAGHDRQHAMEYLRLDDVEGIPWGMIRAAWSSVADLAVAPIQDFLELGNPARMNLPSTVGGNWAFRVAPGALTGELARRIANLTTLYQRGFCGGF